MKKLFTLVILFAFTLSTQALDYYCGQHGDAGDQRNVKWSNCVWTNSLVFKVKPFASKPGSNDNVIARHGGFVLTVDVNPEVKNLTVGDSSTLLADKRTIKVKQSLILPITHKEQLTLAEFKNSNVEVKGSLKFTLWHKYKNAGTAELRLENTKMFIKGQIESILPVNPQYKCDTRAGFELNLIGSTVFEIDGGVLLDDMYKNDDQNWFNKFTFTVNNGAVPVIKFGKDASISKSDIEVKFKGDVKVGVYTLAEFNTKKSGFEAIRSMKINGNPYNLGDSVQVGKHTVSVKKAPAPRSKDTKTSNDLILEIK